jgi:dienelactone hydrolase
MKNTLMSFAPLLAAFLSTSSIAAAAGTAAVTEKAIDYKEGDTALEGFLATPAKLAPGAKVPLVIVVHEWMGLEDYEKTRAKMLAELGYVAFAADIYGKGVHTKDMTEAGKLAGKYKGDRPLMRKRIQAAIDTASKFPGVYASRIAVIGYCFGGTVALEAARAKMPIVAAVSFHGGLSTPNPKDTAGIKAKVAVFHGADDPTVSPEEVAAFQQEMREAKADWEFTSYGNTVHKFTNPEIAFKPGAAMGYNEKADHRSWQAMQDFFKETFKK